MFCCLSLNGFLAFRDGWLPQPEVPCLFLALGHFSVYFRTPLVFVAPGCFDVYFRMPFFLFAFRVKVVTAKVIMRSLVFPYESSRLGKRTPSPQEVWEEASDVMARWLAASGELLTWPSLKEVRAKHEQLFHVSSSSEEETA